MPRSYRFCGSCPCRTRSVFRAALCPAGLPFFFPHFKPLSLRQQDCPDLQQFLPTCDPLCSCILVQHFRRAFRAGLVSWAFLRFGAVWIARGFRDRGRRGSWPVGSCDGGGFGFGGWCGQMRRSGSGGPCYPRKGWCVSSKQERGFSAFRFGLAGAAAGIVGSVGDELRHVRIVADVGAGWPVQNRVVDAAPANVTLRG